MGVETIAEKIGGFKLRGLNKGGMGDWGRGAGFKIEETKQEHREDWN